MIIGLLWKMAQSHIWHNAQQTADSHTPLYRTKVPSGFQDLLSHHRGLWKVENCSIRNLCTSAISW
jgi:hypothetical protein